MSFPNEGMLSEPCPAETGQMGVPGPAAAWSAENLGAEPALESASCLVPEGARLLRWLLGQESQALLRDTRSPIIRPPEGHVPRSAYSLGPLAGLPTGPVGNNANDVGRTPIPPRFLFMCGWNKRGAEGRGPSNS